MSRQGKVRLAKWFVTLSPKEKTKIVKDVTQRVLRDEPRCSTSLSKKACPPFIPNAPNLIPKTPK